MDAWSTTAEGDYRLSGADGLLAVVAKGDDGQWTGHRLGDARRPRIWSTAREAVNYVAVRLGDPSALTAWDEHMTAEQRPATPHEDSKRVTPSAADLTELATAHWHAAAIPGSWVETYLPDCGAAVAVHPDGRVHWSGATPMEPEPDAALTAALAAWEESHPVSPPVSDADDAFTPAAIAQQVADIRDHIGHLREAERAIADATATLGDAFRSLNIWNDREQRDAVRDAKRTLLDLSPRIKAQRYTLRAELARLEGGQ